MIPLVMVQPWEGWVEGLEGSLVDLGVDRSQA